MTTSCVVAISWNQKMLSRGKMLFAGASCGLGRSGPHAQSTCAHSSSRPCQLRGAVARVAMACGPSGASLQTVDSIFAPPPHSPAACVSIATAALRTHRLESALEFVLAQWVALGINFLAQISFLMRAPYSACA